MAKFESKDGYITTIGTTLIKFDKNGLFESDDKDLIEALEKNSNVKMVKERKTKQKEELIDG